MRRNPKRNGVVGGDSLRDFQTVSDRGGGGYALISEYGIYALPHLASPVLLCNFWQWQVSQMRVTQLRLWYRFRLIDFQTEVAHDFVINTTDSVKVTSVSQRLTGYAVVIRPSDVVVQMTAIGIRMRRYNDVTVRRETTCKFHTGKMREINVKRIILVQFVRVKRLNCNFSLVDTPRVTRMFCNSVTDELHRCSIRRSADNRVRSGAYVTFAHALVRTVNGIHRCSANTLRSLYFYD